MEETFNKIHDNKGAAVSSGVDPNAATMASNEAAQATKKESAEGGGNSGFNDAMPVPNLASFSVYWDVATKKYKVFEPRVVGPGGNEITVTPVDPDYGVYCCEIRRTSSGGSYEAKIKLLAQVERDEKTVAVVRLFQISDDKVVQYHTGVINVNDMSITGEEGQDVGSQADPVSGNIIMSGAQGSGLSVLSFVMNETENHVCLDLEGRDRGKDQFGIHKVTDSKGTEKAKVFSTADIKLEDSGVGEDTITVLTGFELSYSDGKIMVTWKKADLAKIAVTGTSTSSPETLLELESFDAVEKVEYSDKKFTQTKHTIYVPGMETNPQNPDDVFTATPHSNVS